VAGVGAKAVAQGRVEPINGPEQAEVALGDEVRQGQAPAGVALGDLDHQAEVGADEVVAGLGVAAGDAAGEFLLLVGSQQRRLADVTEVSR
jgi:hypothetical protein